MHINFYGQIEDQPEIRAGVIGCGSHSFRNVYPTFQFAPVDLVATCDLDADKARAFARAFGAKSSYTDYREMLAREELDAVFIVTGYDAKGRPLYPDLTVECLRAGGARLDRETAGSEHGGYRTHAGSVTGDRQARYRGSQEDVLPGEREGQGADGR